MRVTVERQLVHRCPYRAETDIGTVRASWDGDSVELHALADYLDLWANEATTHENLTEAIVDFLDAHAAENVEVVTTWQTAGMAVTVTA